MLKLKRFLIVDSTLFPQANLTVAIQQEPLKLVRPEDLTKLSLIEDDTLDLPSAKV